MNARENRWRDTSTLGAFCNFEGKRRFPGFGINLNVLPPGRADGPLPPGERAGGLPGAGRGVPPDRGRRGAQLKTWDFFHCPPGTEHIIVGAGKEPAVVLAVGARGRRRKGLVYPVSKIALKHNAGVERGDDGPVRGVRQLRRLEALPVSGRLATGPLGVFPGVEVDVVDLGGAVCRRQAERDRLRRQEPADVGQQQADSRRRRPVPFGDTVPPSRMLTSPSRLLTWTVTLNAARSPCRRSAYASRRRRSTSSGSSPKSRKACRAICSSSPSRGCRRTRCRR